MELSKEAYQAWRRLPETKTFLAYLMGRRSDLMEHWAEGNIKHVEHDACVAEAMLYKSIAELSFDEIEFFFSK